MYDEIRSIVLEQFTNAPTAQIGLDDDLWQLGMESLTCVSVMLGVETAFDMEFPEETLTRQTFSTIRSIADAVSELLGSRTAGAI